MVKTLKNVAICLGVLLLLFGAGFLTGRKTAKIEPVLPQRDTTYIRDTIVDYKPQQAEIPAGFELVPAGTILVYDAILAAYRDSLERKPALVTIHDTTYIAVPINQTTFTDNKTYECLVEGYASKMLWHKSFQETKIVPVPELYPPKWSFSPVVSGFVGANVLSVGAGLELNVWSGRWQFRPGISYNWGYNNGLQWHGVVGSFSLSYNLFRK